MLQAIRDGLANLVSGLGTDRDKAGKGVYSFQALDDARLLNAYRASGLTRKIIDIPARDAVRQWREWSADEGQIALIEAEERRLGLKAKVLEAQIAARLFGGAVIYIATGDDNLEEPLDPTRIRSGGIQYLTVASRRYVNPTGEHSSDPRDEHFGKAAFYSVGGGGRIHPSRLAVFRGNPVPDQDISGIGAGFGDSVLNTILSDVTRQDETAGNIASLVFEAKIDVVNIEGLMDNLAARGAAFEKELLQRFRLGATGKGINGMMILDAKEQHSQKTASFAGLHDILDRTMVLVAAAADIPITRLYGRSPAGMNSTGEADAKNYAANVGDLQENEIDMSMAVLNEALIHSALGQRPRETDFTWRPIDKPGAKERSEIGERIAKTFETIIRTDTLPREAVASALVNALTEAGAAPGLEAAVDEEFALGGGGGEDEDDET